MKLIRNASVFVALLVLAGCTQEAPETEVGEVPPPPAAGEEDTTGASRPGDQQDEGMVEEPVEETEEEIEQ